MRLTINNQDGSGAVDYTGSLLAPAGISLKRTLNAPSICTFTLLPSAQNLPVPSRYAAVVVTDDEANTLFTGYVSAPPMLTNAALSTSGYLSQAYVHAVSDEITLDSTLTLTSGTTLNQPASQTLQTFNARTGATGVTVSPSSTSAVIGRFASSAGTTWSANTGALAMSARSAYRVVAGVAQVAPAGGTTHSLSEADGTLQLGGLKASTLKLLANDVTVCGALEPAAYAAETFQGDGVTTGFTLSEPPFEAVKRETITITDAFQQATLSPATWVSTDSSSRLSITSNGLTCSGGSGRDAETVVSALQQIEMGGAITLEAGGVQFQQTSSGVLLGLYFGAVSYRNCMVGFAVASVNNTTQITALINGSQPGAVFKPQAGHLYTLRTRLFCFEMERVLQSYYYLGSAGTGSQGGEYVSAGGRIVLEVQDVTNGVPGVPVTLYDGSLSVFPAVTTLALINSGNLSCSIKTLNCKQGSPLWAVMTPASGNASTIKIGTAATGGMCSLLSNGQLTFYPGFVPPVGALITVFYRTRHRAIARRSNGQAAASPAPPTQMWIGSIHTPPAWSSMDCDNAALALLQSSAVASAAWEGTYTAVNIDQLWDVWPGDVLAINSGSNNINADVVVREVQIDTGCSWPQSIKYTVRFANDWAENLALKLSSTVPEDAWLPVVPATTQPLNNLGALTVTAVTTGLISISTNVTAPQGGGFEVKRRDWTFGPGTDSDLVLRSQVANFTIPRAAPVEQYFIRMYDGASPPNYSGFSAAVFVNVPM